ncbi:MAG TPA: hypothetical protein VE974_14495 [Thermoanaerobaculia bacterium]|nr:hypothetical protein [Thermoanaerobaculia bacterium]
MKQRKNMLEWVVFGVSVVAIAAVVAALLTGRHASGETPPRLEVRTGAPVAIAGSYRVPVTVENSGDRTAEGAHIEVALTSGEEIVERGELTIAFVPRGSTRNGWVTFRNDPRRFTIVARATGFNEP